jgi:hypothetical protein
VLAAHEVAYRVAVPDDAERAELLHVSGHGWFATAPLVVAMAFAALAAAVATAKHPGRVRHTLAPLAALAYVAVELVERLAHGIHDHGAGTGLVHAPTLLSGAAFAAALAALASALLHRATAAVVEIRFRPVRLRAPRPATRAGRTRALVRSLSPRQLASDLRERGPPVAVVVA